MQKTTKITVNPVNIRFLMSFMLLGASLKNINILLEKLKEIREIKKWVGAAWTISYNILAYQNFACALNHVKMNLGGDIPPNFFCSFAPLAAMNRDN